MVADDQLEVLRLLVDRRRSLSEEHTRKIARLQALLLELIPGGAKVFLSAAQARNLLASVRPRNVVGNTRKRVAMELVVDLEKIYARTKAADKELTQLVKATGTRLLDLHGIAPSGAARLLVEVGDITRSPTAATSRPGPALHPSTPHPATTSGTGSPAAATARSTGYCTSWPSCRCATPPKDLPTSTARRHQAKTSMEAIRCLKRRLSDLVYKTMLDYVVAAQKTGPAGQPGNDCVSSVTGSQASTGSSDKSLPGPAKTKPKRTLPAAA